MIRVGLWDTDEQKHEEDGTFVGHNIKKELENADRFHPRSSIDHGRYRR